MVPSGLVTGLVMVVPRQKPCLPPPGRHTQPPFFSGLTRALWWVLTKQASGPFLNQRRIP